MPSLKPRITDMLSKIGLKAPCTQRREDYNKSPFVTEFWTVDVADLCRLNYLQDNDDIRTSQSIADTAAKLADKYGPAIWPDSEARPWLYRPGEGYHPRAEARYEKDLYYSNPQDQALLKQSLYDLILQKVLGYHKRHYHTAARDSSTEAYQPSLARRSTRQFPGTGRTLECFDCSNAPGKLFDATWLKQHGVWLGNDDDDSDDVNGPSFEKVRKHYFDDTTGGRQTSRQEPFTLSESATCEVLVRCAACQEFDIPSRVMTLRLLDFKYEVGEEDLEEETTMDLMVWGYFCQLGGKNVFALLKPHERRLGANAQYWSFWKVDGGYTNTALLVSVDVPETSETAVSLSLPNRKRTLSLPRVANTKQRRLDNPSAVQPPHAAQLLQVFGAGDIASDAGSDGHITSDTWQPLNRQVSETIADDESRQSTREPTAGPAPLPGNEDEKAASNDWDSLYDTTPQPVSRAARQHDRDAATPPGAPAGLLRAAMGAATTQDVTAQGNATQTQTPHNDHNNMPPPRSTVHIRVDIRGPWGDGRIIVSLNDLMKVQDVFKLVQARAGKRLTSKPIAALSLWWKTLPTDAEIRASGKPDPALEGDSIEVDINDDCAWEYVLELCKAYGVTNLCGTAFMSD